MPSVVTKRSIVIAGHKTSVSLEDCFWMGLKEIAQDAHSTLSNLIEEVDSERVNANLSCALRMYIFRHFYVGQLNGHGQLDAGRVAGST